MSVLRSVLIVALVLVLVAAGLVLWVTRDRALAIVHPLRSPVQGGPLAYGFTNTRAVSFNTSDGLTLQGWYIPSANGAAVVFVHGHGNNRTGQAPDAKALVDQGFGALLFDLRNHGESAGTVTTLGYYEARDVDAAVDFVKTQPGVDPDRVGVLGQSLGGSAVILSAAHNAGIKAVVAESTFTSVEDNITTGVEKLAGLPSFPFAPLIVFWDEQETGLRMVQIRPIDEIPAIGPRPLLLVHGELDDLIPVENARQLYAAAREPKELYLIPNAGHENFVGTDPAYPARIVEFFTKALLQQ